MAVRTIALYASSGTIVTANGAVFGIPANQNGTALRADDLIPGQANRRDARKMIDLLPQQISHSLYAAFDQNIASGVHLFARGLYAIERGRRPDQNIGVPYRHHGFLTLGGGAHTLFLPLASAAP